MCAIYTPDSSLLKVGVRDQTTKDFREERIGGWGMQCEIEPMECSECVHHARVTGQ